MPRWEKALVLAAALSLALGASGQAQDQRGGSQRDAGGEQSAAKYPPFAIPVDIIEDKAEAEATKRREQEADQREIEDLIAQKGMNAATQAMNLATQDMRDYALYSTILVSVGTILLFATLYLTRQANRAALKSVNVAREIGVAQTRAYIGVPHVEACIQDTEGITQTISVTATIGNSGQSPAINTRFRVNLSCPCVFPEHFMAGRGLVLGQDIMSGERNVEILRVDRAGVPENMKARLPSEPPFFRVIGEIEYETVFKDDGITTLVFSLDLVCPPDGEAGVMRVRPTNIFTRT